MATSGRRQTRGYAAPSDAHLSGMWTKLPFVMTKRAVIVGTKLFACRCPASSGLHAPGAASQASATNAAMVIPNGMRGFMPAPAAAAAADPVSGVARQTVGAKGDHLWDHLVPKIASAALLDGASNAWA